MSNGCGKYVPSFDRTDVLCKDRAYTDIFFINMNLHVHKESVPTGKVSWAVCACEDKERCVFNGLRETNSVVLSSLYPLMSHGMIDCGQLAIKVSFANGAI